MSVQTIKDIDPKGKRVLVRVDFNVPLNEGVIGDDTRIRRALPTLNNLLQRGASLVVMSHLGRPKGKKNPLYSMRQLKDHFAQLLGREVIMAPDVCGPEVEACVAALNPGDVLLLENTRFYREEEDNDAGFSAKLARLADFYVNDAFGTAHRAHASTVGVAQRLPAVAGLLMEKECAFFDALLEHPQKPFLAIIGGAKVSSKIAVLESLLERCDSFVIGGGMAYTFLKVLGHPVGNSLVEDDFMDTAKAFLDKAARQAVSILLPLDHLVADQFSADALPRPLDSVAIPEGKIALDIGPKTIDSIRERIARAKTIVWNGPMGVFEFEEFAKGTLLVAQMLADCQATTVVGGGDSVAAVNKFDLASKIDHVSTGGGASLEYLEGKNLPGVLVLKES